VFDKAGKGQQDRSCDDKVLRRVREGTNVVKQNKGMINLLVIYGAGNFSKTRY